jgi:Uma2 family endonuclease
VGKQPVRIAFLDGVMEIMSILPEHESVRAAIGDLVKAFTQERQIARKSFGSTTFRREDKAVGAEPDECFYLNDIESVKGMKRFDPLVHRPPDLWIEVDIFNPSVPREPIYARLGVPEIWRFDGKCLTVRLLTAEGIYIDSVSSKALPELPMVPFSEFIQRMVEGNETDVMRHFIHWIHAIPLA